jgi:hypothetical protein
MRLWFVAAVSVLLSLSFVPTGNAQSGFAGWDGTNPFVCELQNTGTGTNFPHPEADPFCVEFDKTHQNVTQLGIVDFLSKEPARTAAASPKCFYFQSDHWKSYVVQGNGQTEVYQWDGHYFFDKARGMGGVWVTNFAINGRTADPSSIPGIPQQYAQYLGPGTGGFIFNNDVPVDPTCAAKAKAHPGLIYASQRAAGGGTLAGRRGRPFCIQPHGAVRLGRLGRVRMGERERRVRSRLGVPANVRHGYLRYCVKGGGALLVGERRTGVGAVSARSDRGVIAIATSSAYRFGAFHVGSSAHRFARRFHGARLVAHVRRRAVWRIRGSDVLVATARGRIRFLAVYDRHRIHGREALVRLLRRAL